MCKKYNSSERNPFQDGKTRRACVKSRTCSESVYHSIKVQFLVNSLIQYNKLSVVDKKKIRRREEGVVVRWTCVCVCVCVRVYVCACVCALLKVGETGKTFSEFVKLAKWELAKWELAKWELAKRELAKRELRRIRTPRKKHGLATKPGGDPACRGKICTPSRC